MSSAVIKDWQEQDLEAVLACLETSLFAFRHVLTAGTTKERLDAVLHNDNKLPDPEILEKTGRIIDLLGSLEHLLEPASVVLADHFLGASLNPPRFRY